MRLTGFITEMARNTDPYPILVELYKVSFPFIKEYIKASGNINMKSDVLWSGRTTNLTHKIRNIRSNRYPKDSPEEFHSFVDDAFNNEFGVRYRSNSVFVTGNRNVADDYGDHVFGIFPTGTNYSYAWSENITDMFSELSESGNYPYIGEDVDYVARDLIDDDEVVEDAYERVSSQADEDINPDDYDDGGEYDRARQDYMDENLEDAYEDIAYEAAERKISENESEITMIVDDYNEGDLKYAIASHNEVMLSGGSYMMIRYDYIPYVLAYMSAWGSKKPTPERFVMAIKNMDIQKFPKIRGQIDSLKRHQKYINNDLMSILDK